MRKIGIDPSLLYKGAAICSGTAFDTTLLIPAAGGGLILPQVIGFKERYLTFDVETPEDHSLPLEFLAFTGEGPAGTVEGPAGGPAVGAVETKTGARMEESSPRPQVYEVRFGIMPQFRTRICLDTRWFDGHILFPGHTEGELKVVYHGGRVQPELVKAVTLEVRPMFHDVRLRLWDMTLTDERPSSFPIPDVKLVDELGQYKKKEWPGKVRSLGELKTKLDGVLAKPDAYPMRAWSRYGGWTGKRLGPGTGYFATCKRDGRWWLVDPGGCAFFSAGPDCVRAAADCRIDGIERLFDWLPSRDDPDYRDLFSGIEQPSGFEVRPEGTAFSYTAANLFRIYGKDWHTTWRELVSRQLKSNGMNTIGNWSDQRILGKVTLPYVLPLRRFPKTGVTIFRDFPDVLSGDYEKDAAECAQFLLPFAKDPYLIGYFLRNEPMWAFVDNLIIADEVLYNPAPSVCKDELLRFLKEKYKTPQALSAAWNRPFASFEDLRKPLENASRFSAAALQDQREFSKVLLHAYVTIPARACRKLDPNHLNLGMRWAWISDPDLVTGWENFDVFSINCYFEDPGPALDHVRGLGVDLPILIGEFHFGALDLGLTATGLKGTPNQRERGKAYRYYCQRVAAHPCGVGCHWFQFYDQFPLGRFDGENYNIGLFDVCSLPNGDMMGAIRDCAESIYEIADGSVFPAADPPRLIPMIAF
jgi:hypothetical protein